MLGKDERDGVGSPTLPHDVKAALAVSERNYIFYVVSRMLELSLLITKRL